MEGSGHLLNHNCNVIEVPNKMCVCLFRTLTHSQTNNIQSSFFHPKNINIFKESSNKWSL